MLLGNKNSSPQSDLLSDDEDGECLTSYDHYTVTYAPVPLGHESTFPQTHTLNNDEDGEYFTSYDH